MFFLITGCALITQSQYDDRMSGVSPGDSGVVDGIEVTGGLTVPSDRFMDAGIDNVRVGLHRFEFTTGDDGFIVMHDVYGTVATVDELVLGASRPYQFVVPEEPPEDHYFDWDLDEVGTGAAYMIGAWSDDDDDGVVDEGERLIGGGGEILLANVRDVSADSEFTDGDGWYRLTLIIGDGESGNFSDVFHVADPLVDIDLEANLLPNKRVADALEGQTYQYDGDIRASLFDLEQVQQVWFDQEDPVGDPFLQDAEVHGGNFSFDPLGAPRPEHIRHEAFGQDFEPAGVAVAQFVAFAYDDANHNGAYDLNTEEVKATSFTAGDQSRALAYYEATGLQAAFLMGQGIEMGWLMFGIGGGPGDGQVLPWDDGILLGDEGF